MDKQMLHDKDLIEEALAAAQRLGINAQIEKWQPKINGGPAPVRRFLPELIDLVWTGKVNPGKVFDLTLPLGQVAEGYRAMDERRAIKTLLRP
jgi:threonine dehydrogenase-like Zn-dependent dehydrogenase